MLAEEEWLYARAKEFVQDLQDAEYIDEDILEPACTSLLNQYLERRQADKDTLEYLPSQKTINKIIDRMVARALGKEKRKLTSEEIQLEEARKKRIHLAAEARRKKDKKEKRQ